MEIDKATNTDISRQITFESDAQEKIEFQILTDASQQAYGACAYLVKGITSSLIITKNRVAPVKTLSRLELMVALIGANDSQIMLSWISSPKTLPIFESNRLTEIRKLAVNFDKRYCPTCQNPEDHRTRGITAKQLMNSELLIKGPKWIANKAERPNWKRNVEYCNTFSTITEEYMDAEIHVPKTKLKKNTARLVNWLEYKHSC
ncbi:Hypothetical predicted protein [Mytilus galloprovincialis]|uniref:Uncharacterized protein n=1 Tax=Mytilus galloprovincialis TaxID=29158 RepID=A0A8B6C2B1_MYTGA|nr:Hypothetical predicted protein [Mytilus galloprovincialis]